MSSAIAAWNAASFDVAALLHGMDADEDAQRGARLPPRTASAQPNHAHSPQPSPPLQPPTQPPQVALQQQPAEHGAVVARVNSGLLAMDMRLMRTLTMLEHGALRALLHEQRAAQLRAAASARAIMGTVAQAAATRPQPPSATPQSLRITELESVMNGTTAAEQFHPEKHHAHSLPLVSAPSMSPRYPPTSQSSSPPTGAGPATAPAAAPANPQAVATAPAVAPAVAAAPAVATAPAAAPATPPAVATARAAASASRLHYPSASASATAPATRSATRSATAPASGTPRATRALPLLARTLNAASAAPPGDAASPPSGGDAAASAPAAARMIARPGPGRTPWAARSLHFRAELSRSFASVVQPVDVRSVWCTLCCKPVTLRAEFDLDTVRVHFQRSHPTAWQSLQQPTSFGAASVALPTAPLGAGTKRGRSVSDASIGEMSGFYTQDLTPHAGTNDAAATAATPAAAAASAAASEATTVAVSADARRGRQRSSRRRRAHNSARRRSSAAASAAASAPKVPDAPSTSEPPAVASAAAPARPRRGRRPKGLKVRAEAFRQRLKEHFGDQFTYIDKRACMCTLCPKRLALSGDFRLSNLRVHNAHKHRDLVENPPPASSKRRPAKRRRRS